MSDPAVAVRELAEEGFRLRPRRREAGMIKSSPQKILVDNTDWGLLNELERELKA